jgi:predicted DCC family thiol-disulfide oxidoreductase YuxK
LSVITCYVRVAQESRDRLTVLFDADCGFCTRSASLLRRLDRGQRLDLVPLQAAAALADAPPERVLLERMHVRESTGRWSIGGAAWLRIADVVPALRPLAWFARLPFIRPLVEPVYAVIANQRHRLGRLLGDDACGPRTNA